MAHFTANELIAWSEKLERTMDCKQVSHLIYREYGNDCHLLPFYKELHDYLDGVLVRETHIHPNGYTYYKWVDANLVEA